jgi:hypothetical protein
MRPIQSATLQVAMAIAADPSAGRQNQELHEHGYATAPYWRGPRPDGLIVVDGGACPGMNALAVVHTNGNYAVVTTAGHVQVRQCGELLTPRKDISSSETQWAGVAPEEGCEDWKFVAAVTVLVPPDIQGEFWRRVAGYSSH